MGAAAPRNGFGTSWRGVRQLQSVTTGGGVARPEAASGVRFQHITAARDETERRLVERRSQIASVQIDEAATVVLMGSWGRREVTSESDDDFMVLLVGESRSTQLVSRPRGLAWAGSARCRSPYAASPRSWRSVNVAVYR